LIRYSEFEVAKPKIGSGMISMKKYLGRLSSYPHLLKQSIDWRLDHILDVNVPIEIKDQWIDEVKEILTEIIREDGKGKS